MRRAVARGRVFPQSFSTDRRYGRLSLKACALFPLMWANGDDQGRLCGDPEEVKYSVCPNIDHLTKADMPGLLKELEQNGLIKVYETPKAPAIQLLDWWEVNHKMQWAWPSDYPPPDGWRDRLRYKKGAATVITQNWPTLSGEGQSSAQVSSPESNTSGEARSNGQASGERRPGEAEAGTHVTGVTSSGEGKTEAQVESGEQNGAFSHLTSGHGSSESPSELSGEGSGEGIGGSQVDTGGDPSSFPRSPYHHLLEEKEEETRRGRGRGKRNSAEFSPEPSGENSPSPTAAACPDITILDRLSSCFRKEWGRVRAERPDEIIPREPDARESAQLRDLAKELSVADGCPLDYIDQAFRDAAGRPDKMHVSYVRAILIDWLGLERVKVRPP